MAELRSLTERQFSAGRCSEGGALTLLETTPCPCASEADDVCHRTSARSAGTPHNSSIVSQPNRRDRPADVAAAGVAPPKAFL